MYEVYEDEIIQIPSPISSDMVYLCQKKFMNFMQLKSLKGHKV